MSYDNEIKTILAELGKDGKDPVGSFAKGHLVFLPRGCESEREYRIKLQGVVDAQGQPKLDRRGKQLYRGLPAPDVQSEGWRDNNDGTLSWCRVTTNWKLEESIHVLETRQKARKDGSPSVRSTFSTGLSTARIEVTTKTEIPEVEECFSGYGDRWPSYLSTREVAWRDGGTKVESFAVECVEATRSGYSEANDWLHSRLRRDHGGEPTLYVGLKLTYSTDKYVEVRSTKWSDFPVWLQAHLDAPYPLCACGRERVDTPAGHAACSHCRRESEQQATIDAALSAEKRQEFARVAAACDAAAGEGKAWEGEAGAELVIALTDHVRPEDLGSWKGYPWYYLTAEGVYASRFPPEAMMILADLVGATGRGLITLASWLTAEHRAERCGEDFYARTQVRSEEVEPRVDRHALGGACVAVKLRGSEAERQEAVAALEYLRSKLGESSSHVRVVDRILHAKAQDYGAALARAAEAETILASVAGCCFGGHVRRMGATGNADYFVVRADGSLRDPDSNIGRRRWESAEGDKTWEFVDNDELALVWSKGCTRDPHVFHVAYRPEAALTEAQRETVLRLEEEVYRGASGQDSPEPSETWADQLGLRELVARREVGIRDSLRRSRVLTGTPDFSFRSLATRQGEWVRDDEVRGGSWAWRSARSLSEEDWGRDGLAQVIELIPAGEDGVVEILAVERRGEDRPMVHVRWRPRRAGDTAPKVAPVTPTAAPAAASPAASGKVDVSTLDLSKLFGGAANVKNKKR
jgi:hypothetical protein